LHVDGAFGLFAALSPEHAPMLEGLVRADSVAVDLHKWLNVPYDSAVAFTRHPALRNAVFSVAAAYLGDAPEPFHATPENSRRLRALPAWFTLAAYGREGIAEWVVRNIATAREFAMRLAEIDGVRLLSPVHLNVVCFGFEDPDPRVRDRVLDSILRATGVACLTPTMLRGWPALRAAFVDWRTRDEDARRVAEAIAHAV
jgi:glutamate/tyrosine decarboxylase-like PLP-dependent enzyme